MAEAYLFREFQENQQYTLEQAVQAHQAYLDAQGAAALLKGGMHWKTIKGRQYLYKYRDRYGHGGSLGVRSPETEGLLADYQRRRREAADRLATRRQQLAEAARFCRAALLHRVPEPVIRILRRLEPGEPAGTPVMVIGTQALHAFEFAAGVFIDTPKDSPLWTGADHCLTLAAAAEIPPEALLSRLRQGDRSFGLRPGDGFTAVNRHGFQVRFVWPNAGRNSPKPNLKEAPGGGMPAETGDLAALVHSPKFSQVVIGRRGEPATMVTPDPRALALHLLWRSQQKDRDPAPRARDRLQAMALAELILRYLPQYHFFTADLRWFPAEVARRAQSLVEGYELPGDLEVEY